MRRHSASESSRPTRSSMSRSGRGRSRISATGSKPADMRCRGAASARTRRSPRRCRCTGNAASRRGCKSRWDATPCARTASSPQSADVSRAAARERSSRRWRRSPVRASRRSRCSGRTSTPGAATSPPTCEPSSASCYARVTRSRASSGSASRARTRRTSAHPVIAAIADCAAVCEHIHLPLQSGSTRLLKAMRRTYTRERYLRLVAELREAIPDLALGHGHHRRLPGGDRRGLPGDARRRRGRRLRQRLHLRVLAARGNRGGLDAGPGAAGREARAHGAPRRRWFSASQRIGTALASGESRRFSSRDRAGLTLRCSVAGRAETPRSTSRARPSRGSSSPS